MSSSATRLKHLEEQLRNLKPRSSKDRPLEFPFPQRRAWMDDPSPRKGLFCTRRAAKSLTFARYMCETNLRYPESVCLYIALTGDSAEKILWHALKKINREYRLGAKFNETDRSATFANGSVSYLLGVDQDEGQKDKLYGMKLKLVGIDEAPLWKTDIRRFINDTLDPATLDDRGTICLMGVANPYVKRGLFYDLTKNFDASKPFVTKVRDPDQVNPTGNWSFHGWPGTVNPYIAQEFQDKVDSLIKENGPEFKQVPFFVCNYLGRWAIDLTKLVYKYSETNAWDGELPSYPQGSWSHTLGVDLGFTNPSAFTVTAFHDNDPAMYIRRSFQQPGLDFTGVAQTIHALQTQYDEQMRIVIDGANKQGVAEMCNRLNLPLELADKRGKEEFIGLMNADFTTGKIQVDTENCDPLLEEYSSLTWREIERAGMVTRRVEHGPNHCADSALYAWRANYSYLFDAMEEFAPRPGFVRAQGKMIQDERLDDLLERNKQEHDDLEPSDQVSLVIDRLNWLAGRGTRQI